MKVWATVTDITNMGKWSPSNTGGKWTKGASGPATGAHFAAWNRKGVARWVTHCEVIECEEPSKFAFQVAENHMQWGWKLAPTDDGVLRALFGSGLDLAGLAHLTQALRAYSGALVVVSHDERFLEEVMVDRSVELER